MYLYRTAIEELKRWKNGKNRKPLIIEGARQVGKTSLLKRFGEEFYDNVAYVNLEEDELAKEIFDGDFEPSRIIARLAIRTGVDIKPEKTLIVLDEVQENPRALTALKYFCEEAPEYHVVVAGSLLGLSFHNGVSYPVGKVEYVKVHPLTFVEFLMAVGKKRLAEELQLGNFELIAPFHEEMNDYLKQYMVVGGMPEVVKTFVEDGTMVNVRKIQSRINKDYQNDFSKHADRFDAPKILEIFNTMPAVLAKENKKFMFGMIKSSARAREYEAALLWLVDSEIAVRVNRINKLAVPPAAYLDMNAFKLFSVDVGLLGEKAALNPEMIYNEKAFEEFKGTLAEQFVFQELHAKNLPIYYYSADQSNAEIDFVVGIGDEILPIEVKSGGNLSSVSLTRALEENKELRAVKFSMLPYQENERMINAPLYATTIIK